MPWTCASQVYLEMHLYKKWTILGASTWAYAMIMCKSSLIMCKSSFRHDEHKWNPVFKYYMKFFEFKVQSIFVLNTIWCSIMYYCILRFTNSLSSLRRNGGPKHWTEHARKSHPRFLTWSPPSVLESSIPTLCRQRQTLRSYIVHLLHP